MQITFQVPVVLKAKPGRVKNDRMVYGYHPVTLDVPVIDAADAPVVIEYKTKDRNGFLTEEAFRGCDGTLYHDIRALPGETVSTTVKRHPHPDGLYDRQAKRIEEANQKVFDAVGRDYLSQAAAQVYPQSYADYIRFRPSEVELEPISEMGLKGDFERELAAQVAEFTRNAERLVIIDGRFHFPEPEPMLRVVPAYVGDVAVEAVRYDARQEAGTLGGEGLNMDVLGYFRLDETDRLETVLDRFANGNTVIDRVLDIDVIDPGYLSENSEALTLVEMGTVFRQYFARHLVAEEEWSMKEKLDRVAQMLASLPVGQLALYQRLCAGIEAAKAGGDTAELEEAVMTIMESDHGSLERHLFVYGGSVARYAEIMIERWNDRPVEAASSLSIPSR